jgi:hypothetical protein
MIKFSSKELSNQAKKEIKELLGKFPEYLLMMEVLIKHEKGIITDEDLKEIHNMIDEYYSKKDPKVSDGESSSCSSYDNGQCCLTFSPCDVCTSKAKIE